MLSCQRCSNLSVHVPTFDPCAVCGSCKRWTNDDSFRGQRRFTPAAWNGMSTGHVSNDCTCIWPPPPTLPHHPVPDSGYLRSISTRTLRSAGGTRTVLDAWHLYVLFRAVRVILCISRRFTVTWRPIDTPPPVCITSSPFSHVTVGSGRPAMSQQDSQRAPVPGFSW